MKNKAKIVVAAGAVLAGALAVAPAQAHAATRTLIGSCSAGFACAWGTNDVLFWESNAHNITLVLDEEVTYVQNRTGYNMYIHYAGTIQLPPDTGLIDVGPIYVYNVLLEY